MSPTNYWWALIGVPWPFCFMVVNNQTNGSNDVGRLYPDS